MTAPRRVNFDTLEQILSADANRIGALSGKTDQDIRLLLEKGFEGATPRNCVLGGLDANPGAALSIDLDAGEFCLFDVSITDQDLSQYTLGKVASLTNVPLTAADPANPRVDLIYAIPTALNTDSATRNVLTLPSRVVTPTSVNKTVTASATVGVVTGTPAVNPLAPALPAGAIALWYVFVPAAAVGPLTDNELADARVPLNPSAISRSHGRVEGLYMTNSTLTDVFISSGVAIVDGVIAKHDTGNQSFLATDIFPLTGGALAADTEYHLYCVPAGMPGHPVGKSIQDKIVFVLSTTTPDPDGRPSGVLFTYRPLRGLHDEWAFSATTNALYLGTLSTDGSALFQIGGDATPINLDGTIRQKIWDPGTGAFAGGVPTFLRPPQLNYVSNNTVRLGQCAPAIGGIPGARLSTLDGSFPTALVSTDPPEAANTIYYVYLRNEVAVTSKSRGVVRDYRLVFSSEAPNGRGNKPTPEGGFTVQDYVFVGSFFNNAGSDIEPFDRIGNQVLYRNLQLLWGAIVTASPGFSTIPAGANIYMPQTSRMLIIQVNASSSALGAGGNFQNTWQLFAGVTSTTVAASLNQGLGFGGIAGGEFIRDALGQLMIATDSNGQFRANRINGVNFDPATSGLTINQAGYVEDILALPF
jgi:hypothetical protein